MVGNSTALGVLAVDAARRRLVDAYRARDNIVSPTREAVKAYQKQNGFYDPLFLTLVKLSTMQHWAPLPDGIHIWFDKYVAGPGMAGVVEITVPYPSTAVIKP